MSDEPDANEELDAVFSDSEHALATYGTSAAECAQAFGNLLVQTMPLKQDDPRFPIVMKMLTRLVNQLEANPKGSAERFAVVKD